MLFTRKYSLRTHIILNNNHRIESVNYSETFGTVQIWDSILYRLLFKQQIACPPKISKEKVPYPGAYVKDPQTGMHDWVVSFDLNSLYPMIIVQYNMSPETVLDGKQHLGLDPVERLR